MTDYRFDWLGNMLPQKLAATLGPDNIKFVGGAVRDSLIDRPVNDIDAATSLPPEKVSELLKRAGISVIPTGLKHGTVTAHFEGETIEVTTLRVDLETDGRHAKVGYTKDWHQDAARRDFTFNAFYVDIDGQLFDPFDGVSDLLAGKVRFIGNADERIQEDALRVLRFFRFFAWYGKGALDPAGLKACGDNVALIKRLSIERVRDEMLKLLKAADPLISISAMKKSGVLLSVMPLEYGRRQHDISAFEGFLARERKSVTAIDPLMRLVCLFGPEPRFPERLTHHFKLSNRARNFMRRVEQAHNFAGSHDKLKEAIYRFGYAPVEAALLLDPPDFFESIDWTELRGWEAPLFPVRGRDLIDLGIEPGPRIADTLSLIEGYWISQGFKPSKRALLASINKLKVD